MKPKCLDRGVPDKADPITSLKSGECRNVNAASSMFSSYGRCSVRIARVFSFIDCACHLSVALSGRRNFRRVSLHSKQSADPAPLAGIALAHALDRPGGGAASNRLPRVSLAGRSLNSVALPPPPRGFHERPGLDSRNFPTFVHQECGQRALTCADEPVDGLNLKMVLC
jgi:hypothetical protein